MTIGQGTVEYTVGSIVDRLLIQWITPPDAQYALAELRAPVIDASITTVNVGTFLIPEDEALLRLGVLLEVGQELMRVTAWDAVTGTATVIRGAYGTPASAHMTPQFIALNPQYPRATLFEAVADNIIQLYPSLYTTHAELLASVAGGVLGLGDELAVEVLNIRPGDWQTDREYNGEIIDFHPMAGGRAVLTDFNLGSAWVRYRRRMGRAVAESDSLDALGVDSRWVNIVCAGAAADAMAGRDIPASTTEWVKGVLEAESIRVGTRMSIAGGLRQYHGMLMDRAKKEMDAEYNVEVHMNSAFRR